MAKQAHTPRVGARSWIEDAGLLVIAAAWWRGWWAHPVRADRMTVGGYRIGASTAGPAFTGEVLEQSRPEEALSP